ncbi:hypothetical protein [Pararhodospirillum photometricum]|uniref:hypothetical protein n=1 Tax=Pararhodospirillum photometricum TaxID=1084 RepID=UPI001F5ACBBD|nr:hypothetical protein [Pararhodospirillum photometricum]
MTMRRRGGRALVLGGVLLAHAAVLGAVPWPTPADPVVGRVLPPSAGGVLDTTLLDMPAPPPPRAAKRAPPPTDASGLTPLMIAAVGAPLPLSVMRAITAPVFRRWVRAWGGPLSGRPGRLDRLLVDPPRRLARGAWISP